MKSMFSEYRVVRSYFFILLFFGVSILLPENLRNISLFLFSLLIVILLFKKPRFNLGAYLPLLANTSFFLALSVSLFYTQDLNLGLKRITVLAALPVFSVGFYLLNRSYKIDYELVEKFFYPAFYIATVLFFLGVFLQNSFNDHLNEFIFRDYSERINSKYGKYSMHPIYASLYISISLIIATKVYKQITSKIKQVLFYFSIVFLIVILVVLARKGIIVITVLIFTYYLLRNRKKRSLYVFFTLVLILFIASYLIEPIRNRYLEFINALFNSNNTTLGSTSYRLNIYKCCVDRIIENPILGYGVGDTKSILIDCYQEKSNIFNGKYFNSHNQFLSAWLSSGLLGISSLVFTMFYNFKLAIKQGSFVYVSVLIIFLTALFTENILERQNGVLLFSFFINFFIFQNLRENTKTLK